jgi:hypothetical protein
MAGTPAGAIGTPDAVAHAAVYPGLACETDFADAGRLELTKVLPGRSVAHPGLRKALRETPAQERIRGRSSVG